MLKSLLKQKIRILSALLVGITVSVSVNIYAADGALDPTFDNDGKVITDFSSTTDDEIHASAIQPDGKIVVAGVTKTSSTSSFALARYNANGSLDNTFDGDGKVTTAFTGNAIANAVAIQPDGKIVVAGTVNNIPNDSFAVARYNPDGSLDASFNGVGKVTTTVGGNFNLATSVAIQSDGKIVVAGSTFSSSGLDFALARFNSNGSLDNTFDGDGRVVTDLFGGSDGINAVRIQPDGKIIVAGVTVGNTIQTGRAGFGLVRYNTNGTLDNSFDGDGKLITVFIDPVTAGNATGEAAAIAIQPDGKIVATGFIQNSGGVADNKIAAVRYNANGSLDTNFSGDGIATVNFNSTAEQVFALALQSDGKIVLAGTNGLNNGDFLIVRFTTTGSLDTTFDGDGFVFTPISTGGDLPFAVSIQADGKIVAAGRSRNTNADYNFALVRYLSSGASPNNQPPPFDFNGDGKSDVSVFRPSSGTWFALPQSGFLTVQWGASTDLIAPADFNGDGLTDFAVFRPSLGTWFILTNTSNQFSSVQFGLAGDLPRPGDFDGDGKADIAVFRPSSGSWFWLNSSNGQFNAVQFGASGDIPVIGDFDGDRKTDVAVFRPSDGNWYRLNSSNGQFVGVQFGSNGDVPAVGDFDGDGKSDISVFRPSSGDWFRLNSGNGQFSATQFGSNGDFPTVGDYDGDGKSDISVFRPSDGNWYRLNSSNGAFSAVQFGANGDQPIPSAFQ